MRMERGMENRTGREREREREMEGWMEGRGVLRGCAPLFFPLTGLFHIQFTEGKSLTCTAEPQPSRWSLLPPHRNI